MEEEMYDADTDTSEDSIPEKTLMMAFFKLWGYEARYFEDLRDLISAKAPELSSAFSNLFGTLLQPD